jgi:hypothetical protein
MGLKLGVAERDLRMKPAGGGLESANEEEFR